MGTDKLIELEAKPAGSRSPATAVSIAISRRLWRHRAQSWEQQGSQALSKVIGAVLAEAGAVDGDVIVDLGCGSGQLTLPLAAAGAGRILGVDIDPEAIEILRQRSEDQHLANVQVLARPLELLSFADGSVDLIVSNYALHHMRDADKQQLLDRILLWLRPGGRLVIGDMMFGRGTMPEDRAVIRAKVGGLVRRGPGGWWRIAKNGARFLLRFQERPLRPSAWAAMLREAGFEQVATRHVVAEAHIAVATKPVAPSGS